MNVKVTIEQILSLIVNNPEQALIAIEALKVAGKLTKDEFKILSRKFRDSQKLKHFGCTPSDELADKLRKIDSTPEYQRLKSLIGNHSSLKLARIGLYLETLNEQGATLIVNQIRSEIVENMGPESMKILDLGSSGLMSKVIDAVKSLKEELNLFQTDVIKRYEYIVRRMELISIYVKNIDTIPNIKLRIEKKIGQMPEEFFVIASGTASSNTAYAIAQLNVKNVFSDAGYIFLSPNIRPQGKECSQFIWTFYRFV